MHPKSWTDFWGIFMAKKGNKQKKYSAEFKGSVIMDMRENHLGYRETARKYGLVKSSMGGAISTLHRWERIYLTEGAAGFMTERRGRGSKGRPRKKPLLPEAEGDLLDEVQRLRERNEYLEMELEYLKKLDALIRAEEERNGRKPK